MSNSHAVYEKLGYPIVSPEDHEDLTQAIASLADPDSAEVTKLADATPAPSSGPGGNDVTNIYYVNFVPGKDTMDAALKAQFDAVQTDVGLNRQFLDIKAGTALQEKIKSGQIGSNDQTGQANYKAKVVNFLTNNSPWTAGFAVQTVNKTFTVEKNTFHDTLVTTFTDGLNLPAGISTQLEGVLTNIKNTINVSKEAAQGLTFFLLVTIYVKDNVRQAWQPNFRTIYFKVDQSLSTYTRSKGDNSSGVDIKVAIEYAQVDGAFNDQIFVNSAKASVQALISSASGVFINQPVEVPI